MIYARTLRGAGICLLMLPSLAARPLLAQEQTSPIVQRIMTLRQLPDTKRAQETKQLALDIRKVSAPADRLNLALNLANLSTEGDFGHDTLQEVATTLADALRDQPQSGGQQKPDGRYMVLAQLVRYENVTVSLNSPQFTSALKQLEKDDQRREQADFTLTDLEGKAWTLKSLKGKVVLVNFWATWCPPCRKELPDLEALYREFKDRGLVILGISDEAPATIKTFLAKQPLTYPILVDSDKKVNQLFGIEGIPRTVIYDRQGKLAAEAIDMRTRKQLLELLGRAGLH